jgi:hypothetical protein
LGFASTYDTKANFALTVILALTAYLIAELPSYIAAHAKHPQNVWFALVDLAAIGCLGFFLWAVVLIVLTIPAERRPALPEGFSALLSKHRMYGPGRL